MANVITYEEYCHALNKPWNAETVEPQWFRRTQRQAMKLILKCVPQSHLVPTSHFQLSYLKPRFLPDVIEAIAEQIRFIHDNDITWDNGWLNTDTSFGVGQYTQGPMNKFNIERTFRALCPAAYDIFDSLGWLYASLSDKLKLWDYYIPGFKKEWREAIREGDEE